MSFYSFTSVFCRAHIFNFNGISPIIILMDCAFDVTSKEVLPHPRSLRFSPRLFSRNLIFWHFTLRSLIHFNFFERCKFYVSIYLHTCRSPILHHNLEKNHPFLLRQKLVDYICTGLFLGLFYSTDLWILLPISHCPD